MLLIIVAPLLNVVKIMQNMYTINFLQTSLTNKYLFDTIKGMRYTYKQFQKLYPNDDACLDMVFKNRFGDLRACPQCGVVDAKFYKVKKRQCYSCEWCGYQLHPLAGTIFRKTTTPLTDWFHAIYLFSVAKNGVSAKEIERHLGCTYKTAWRICKQVRLLMQQESEKLTGTVEVDETYIGGKGTRNWQKEKTGVYGVTERGGQAKAVVAYGGVSATTALPFLKASVELGSKVMSDESRIYHRVKRDYYHSFVTHSKEEYVKGDVHTNSIEGFWGNMKNAISGTYHCVSPKYLQSYVNEFVFRYNFRDVAVCPVLLELATRPV